MHLKGQYLQYEIYDRLLSEVGVTNSSNMLRNCIIQGLALGCFSGKCEMTLPRSLNLVNTRLSSIHD